MYLFYESDSYTTYLKCNNKVCFKKKINWIFDYYIQNIMKENLWKHSFLIDEDRFFYYSFPVFWEFDKTITINDLNNLIDEKKDYIKENYSNWWYMIFYNIQDIYINWEEKDYIVWEQWKIYFKLNIYYLNNETSNIFKVFAGSNFSERSDINIFPWSFFTVNFLKKNLNKSNFNILYLK